MIHRYQKKGLNFVLDVNSGAVHLLDDISYAVSGLLDENMGDTCPQSIIDALSDYTADEIREAYDELYELKKAGQLFAQDDYIDVSRYIPVNAPVKAHVPACSARLQPALPILLRLHRRLRHGERSIMPLEIGQEGASTWLIAPFRRAPQPGGGLLRRRAAHELAMLVPRIGRLRPQRWRRSITRSSASPSPPTVCCSTTSKHRVSSTERCTTVVLSRRRPP